MIFPNWTGWKTIKALLGAVAAIAASLGAGGVITPQLALEISGVAGALVTLVVTLSGTAAGPTMLVQRGQEVTK
jgi:hypothetical protein